MKLSLYQRLSLLLTLVFVTIASIFYLWSEHVGDQSRSVSQQRLHISLAASLARDNPLIQQGVYDHDALKNLFHTLMVLGPAFEFYLLDPKGNILTHSTDTSVVKREKVDITPLIELTQNLKPLPIFGDDPRHPTRKKIFSAAPVFNGTQLTGYLYVIVAGERYESVFTSGQSSQQLHMSIVLVGTSLLFLFLLMLGIFRYVTNPIRQLQRDMNNLIAADFNGKEIQLSRWQENSNDEVQKLGCMFRHMATTISNQIEQLKQTDHDRRELLSHISHDLRTPLTAMQGYIETLTLNRNSLSEQQKTEFMHTVFRNAKQLNSLIDQIFELAHLETGQVSVDQESFNLSELLYDVSAKFTLQAKAKQVNLTVEPAHSNLVVYCDIGKLERVLTNLIENAIRHTSSGGEVKLQVIEHPENISMCVIDNGTGIKRDELAYIFDARYRASNAVNNGTKHNGLGLAITKQLLQLLHIDISVQSELGKGSQFCFKLRRAA